MKKIFIPLSKSSPYLRDPKRRAFWLKVTVYSSAATERIKVPKLSKTEKEAT